MGGCEVSALEIICICLWPVSGMATVACLCIRDGEFLVGDLILVFIGSIAGPIFPLWLSLSWLEHKLEKPIWKRK
jgi:hypothetical protein